MVRVTLLDGPERLQARSGEWRALLERSATRTVFQTLEWQRCWWSAFGGSVQSLLLAAEDGGRLVGIAPLMLTRQRILGRSCRVVEFIGTHAADYSDVIIERGQREVLSALLQWLADHASRSDLLHLVDIAETSPLLDALGEAFGRLGYATEVRPLYQCPTRRLGDAAADRALLRARTLRNKLSKRGRLEFEVHTGAAQIEARLEWLFKQHLERWAGTATPSFFSDERQRAFYREQARALAPLGWPLLSVVALDGVPISLHFGYEYDGRLYVIKPTFDPRYAKYSPGMLQIRFLLQYAIERGAKEMDFTTGEEPFKYRFANHARQNYAARIHRRSLFYGVDRLLPGMKALVKRSPAAARLARSLLTPALTRNLRRLGL